MNKRQSTFVVAANDARERTTAKKTKQAKPCRKGGPHQIRLVPKSASTGSPTWGQVGLLWTPTIIFWARRCSRAF